MHGAGLRTLRFRTGTGDFGSCVVTEGDAGFARVHVLAISRRVSARIYRDPA